MEEFKWCVRPDFSVDNEPKRNVVQFGDGYSQRQRKELNNLLRKYTVIVKVRNKERLNVDAFLSRHGGVDPFWFNDPYKQRKTKVICSRWPAKVGRVYTEFNCEIEEVP